MARSPTPKERPLHWVGSSKKDLLAFPGTVVDDFGYGLSVVQHGGTPPAAKRWRGGRTGSLRADRRAPGQCFQSRLHGAFRAGRLCPALLSEEVNLRRAHGQAGRQPDPRAPENGPNRLRGALWAKRRLRRSSLGAATCWLILASRTPASGSCASRLGCGSTG